MVTSTTTYGTTDIPPAFQHGGLTVQVLFSENTDLDTYPSMAYRLRVEVTAARCIDPNIFIYESLSPVAGQLNPPLRFVTVATPAYMQELPIQTPGAEEPYCRLPTVDLYFRTVKEAQAGRDNLLRRINLLLENTEALANLRSLTEVTYAFDTDEGGSSQAA